MENMIKKIVEADAKARAFDEKNKQEKEEMSKKIDAEAKRIYDSFMSKAEETVKKNDISEEKKAAGEWAEIQKKNKSALIKLKSDFEANSEAWSDEIVRRTVG